MNIDWIPMLTFLVVASITPGPNNLTAAAMGMRSGFRKTIPFVFGVYLGVALLLTIVGFLKIAVSEFFFRYVVVFKALGSAYLLWLAYTVVRKNRDIDKEKADVSFIKGVVLQLVNPKGLFFAMTMYSLFLTGNLGIGGTLSMAFGLPVVTILCVGIWAFAGSFLSRFLEHPRHRKWFYRAMAILLVYTVVAILTKEFTIH